MSGILEGLATDIMEMKTSHTKLHLGFLELIGNSATDLLNQGSKVDVLEDKFGKVSF